MMTNSLKFLSVFLLSILILISSISESSAATATTNTSSSFIPVSQWKTSFRNLTTTTAACKNGDRYHGLSSVKRYLNRYGYLEDGKSKKYDDLFNDGFRTALMAYQKNFHLKPTGQLDESTLNLMMKPRCGVPDVGGVTTIHGRNLYTFFPGVPRWPPTRTSLTYAFSSGGVTIASDVLSAVFGRAFQRWASVTPLTFTQVSSLEAADVEIKFYLGNHGDGYPFDGTMGILAHAFAPTDGRLHFDASENWIGTVADVASPLLSSSNVAIDLESVAVHEIGHIIGLGHSTIRNAIMYPSISAQTRKVRLSRDDIYGAQALYN